MAETLKTIRNRAFTEMEQSRFRFRQSMDDTITKAKKDIDYHFERRERRFSQFATQIALSVEPFTANVVAESQATAPIVVNSDPIRCDNDYHPPECDSIGLNCKQHEGSDPYQETSNRCKACNAEIYVGNCCGEACTKAWMAEIEAAHRAKSKGKRFCRQCAEPHEMKSNYCGQCLCNACGVAFPDCYCIITGQNQRRILRP